MGTVKVTVTLAEAQLQAIRRVVSEGAARSASAFVQHAVALALDDVTAWQGLLDEALQEAGGELTDAERQWADQVMAPLEADDHAA